jgi:predicted enzyme related to lactoylglutathione lyase
MYWQRRCYSFVAVAGNVNGEGMLTVAAAPLRVFVEDQDRALEFYVHALGCAVSADGMVGNYRYLEVQHSGTGAALALLPPFNCERPTNKFACVIPTRSITDALERCRQHGGTPLEAPAQRPWGDTEARVLDPDGNVIALVQRDLDGGARSRCSAG